MSATVVLGSVIGVLVLVLVAMLLRGARGVSTSFVVPAKAGT